MLSGAYDNESSRIIRRFVGRGQHCVDVGANVGPITLLLAKLVGPDGHVLAVEPGPPYCAALERNLALNPGLGRVVTLLRVGLSDRPGSLLWRPDPAHPYNAGLLDNLDGLPVPVETLDAVVRDWPRARGTSSVRQ